MKSPRDIWMYLNSNCDHTEGARRGALEVLQIYGEPCCGSLLKECGQIPVGDKSCKYSVNTPILTLFFYFHFRNSDNVSEATLSRCTICVVVGSGGFGESTFSATGRAWSSRKPIIQESALCVLGSVDLMQFRWNVNRRSISRYRQQYSY